MAGFNQLTTDPRLVHDGSPRDDAAEAIMCAMAMTRGLDGELYRHSMPFHEMVLIARTIIDRLPELGYTIVKKEK